MNEINAIVKSLNFGLYTLQKPLYIVTNRKWVCEKHWPISFQAFKMKISLIFAQNNMCATMAKFSI